MARVNTPVTYACGHCNAFGHNKRTCPTLAAGLPAIASVKPVRVVPTRFDMLIAKITALAAEANGLGVRQVLVTTLAWDNSTSDPNAVLAEAETQVSVSDAAADVADVAGDVARILASIEAVADVAVAIDAALPDAPATVAEVAPKSKRNRKVA